MSRERAYLSVLTDEQWDIIEPMLPLIKESGRIPKHPFRDVVDAILYLDRRSATPSRGQISRLTTGELAKVQQPLPALFVDLCWSGCFWSEP